MKTYLRPPLPFVGNKRNFRKKFIEQLRANFADRRCFVDLFGGSGLLSHHTKETLPDARVIWNDFDNYQSRLDMIPKTNEIVAKIYNGILKPNGIIGKNQHITPEAKAEIIALLEDAGECDFLTLTSLLFFQTRGKNTIDVLKRNSLYLHQACPQYTAEGYLKGVERVCGDWKEVLRQAPTDAVLLIDPPYLLFAKTIDQYKQNFDLSQWLELLETIHVRDFVLFSSKKSQLLNLMEYLKTKGMFYDLQVYMRQMAKITNGMDTRDYMIIQNTEREKTEKPSLNLAQAYDIYDQGLASNADETPKQIFA